MNLVWLILVDPKYHTFIRDPDFQATQELVGIDPPIAPLLAEVKPQNVLPEKNKSPVEKEAKNKGDLGMQIDFQVV